MKHCEASSTVSDPTSVSESLSALLLMQSVLNTGATVKVAIVRIHEFGSACWGHAAQD